GRLGEAGNIRRVFEAIDVHTVQLRLDVAAFPRQAVLDQREARLGGIALRGRQRIAAAAVAGDAGAGHGLQAVAVEVDRELARAVPRREVVELRELHRAALAVARVDRGDARRGAPLDRVRADVPSRVPLDRCLDVEGARVAPGA